MSEAGELVKHKAKVYVIVRGGRVVRVSCSNPNLQAVILDMDDKDISNEEEEVRDNNLMVARATDRI